MPEKEGPADRGGVALTFARIGCAESPASAALMAWAACIWSLD